MERRAWGDARQAGRVPRTQEKEASRAEGSAALQPHPNSSRLLPRFISQADVMATQQLCGKEQWCPALAGPPQLPAPVP